MVSGNAHFAVAWAREIARTSGPYEQDPHFQRMMQRLGNTEAMSSRLYNQQPSLAREAIKRLVFLRNVAPHEVSGFNLSSW